MKASPFARYEVRATAEFQRVRDLPRRDPGDLDELARELTSVLRTQGGTMALRTTQAQALFEIGTYGGLFGPIRVGGGKTLISLLAPYVLDAKRPILMLPAALVEKTERERRELAKHWRIPQNIRIVSYEMMGRHQAATTLEFYRPDLLVLDEAHRVKNKKAGVTKRVTRYLREHPETRVVAISGTMLKGSLRDFSHLLTWTHREGAPVPLEDGEIEEWANALDEKINPLNRVRAGALLTLCKPEDVGDDEVTSARRGFHRRLVETPGVVVTSGEQVSCSLYLRGHVLREEKTTAENFEILRTKWETPDGWALTQATDVWRHARELALGFHYVWDPRPPEEWLEARRAWAKFVREVLSHSRTLDTEYQVKLACREGRLSDVELREWEKLEPTFRVNQRAVWHDETAIDFCAEWLRHGPGIAWCEHTFFARELEKRTGFPYYGQEGKDRHGNPIESAKGPIIASVAANGTGRNLQRWSRNLVTSCLSSAATWEQLLGRTHRDGQQADEVEVDVLFGCLEHAEAWERSLGDARMAEDLMGQPQKLLVADVTIPAIPRRGARWEKSA